jgi:hypothetical protein
MKRLWLRRVISILLMLSGTAGLVVVFWWYPYTRRAMDGEWQEQHSTLAYWEYTQNYIRRFGWRHDDFSMVGSYGGKEWAEWIFERLAPDNYPGDCDGGHKLAALEYITNFTAGDGTHWEKGYPVWMAWWKENRNKSQEEWMIAGFAAAGYSIQNPPAKEDWPTLLRIIAESGRKGRPREAGYQPARSHLRYNACRCLRDTGFNSVAFALEGNHSPEVRAGLLSYHRFERGHSPDVKDDLMLYSSAGGSADGDSLGRLFKRQTDERGFSYVPDELTPAFRYGWGSAAVVVIFIGIWLFRRNWKPPPFVASGFFW